MPTEDRLARIMGILCGLTGLGILASLDVPIIERGGYSAGFAAFELLAAVIVLALAFGTSALKR